MPDVTIELSTPHVEDLDQVVRALSSWQHDAAPMQLHPGDVGWFGQFGVEATAAAMRTWTRGGRIVAVGFLDGASTLRLTVAPRAEADETLAGVLVADLSDPGRGVLPSGKVAVEAPTGTRIQQRLTDAGWELGESWTPLWRDLSAVVKTDGSPLLRVENVGPKTASDFVTVHRSAWGSPRFTVELWQTMTTGPAFADARCLLGYDERDVPVAGITVWSAGSGRPGLIEPLGVHADHRRRGHARAICLAGAAALREMGSSSALVCTESARAAAVATYEAAGFVRLPQRFDRSRSL